ncbi:sterol desaturase family protein [Antarcticimicrobium luteum]|uniref:Fatty acid hydroxylase domain-containing protein n=1 Tax=Antarcticimicrobium luteum TaxID=2547397 RepID=A0A4R5UQB9_9RHOB|nr:sterol desaturase family protein [Antarcticimicrobium luteum]TDK41071.1 hypothetical protein E1832_20450 [Antarcticimicrobium luteum]
MEIIIAFGQYLLSLPFSMQVRVSAFYLCCTVVLAGAIWLARGRPAPFLSWLLPRAVYRHRSNLLDIGLFLTHNLASFLGVFGALMFTPAVAHWVLGLLGGAAEGGLPITWGRSLAATVLIVMASDFCKYWAHRIHHEWKLLWPFHAVHHSADVLTPLTVMRAHPVESIVRNLLISGLVGVVQALILVLLVGRIDLVTIAGANALYFLFNTLGANLRHSHIWLSYGYVLEHILISPAQHQVHHSVDVRHHDKNYGAIFALWDWMFGTLYVPRSRETLTFGIADAAGQRTEQPHQTLGQALFKPFAESWEALSARLPRRNGAPLEDAMTPGFSLWLDTLRAAAALCVLFGHMAHIRFTGGDYYFLREINIASDAVIVFFVLSGVVIAYTAGRDGSLGRYAFNRVTRLYSVLIPALVLTLAFDAIGTRIDMSAYPADYYGVLPLWEFLARGLSFSNEWQGLTERVRLGTNGPLWSLSYEVGFYMLFGAALFLRGALRWVMLALIALVVGLPVLALLPAWLMGVAVWSLGGRLARIAPARAWPLALLPVGCLILLKIAGLDRLLTLVTIHALAPVSHHALLAYSDEVLWNTVIGACVALHLLGVRHIADGRASTVPGIAARTVRWVAGASFSIYVVHYPTLHLLDATLPETLPGYDLWLLGLTLGTCFAFAALFERPLKRIRALCTPLWVAAARALAPRRARAARAARSAGSGSRRGSPPSGSAGCRRA